MFSGSQVSKGGMNSMPSPNGQESFRKNLENQSTPRGTEPLLLTQSNLGQGRTSSNGTNLIGIYLQLFQSQKAIWPMMEPCSPFAPQNCTKVGRPRYHDAMPEQFREVRDNLIESRCNQTFVLSVHLGCYAKQQEFGQKLVSAIVDLLC